MEISFCGGADEVGASCILLQLDGRNILLDCGIRLNTQDSLPDFRLIQEKGGVDAIVISHAHLDHSGSLPVLSREYSKASIIMTPATMDITRVLLYDSLKIMDREAEIPAYAQGHVEEMLARIKCLSFQNTHTLFKDKNIELTFFQAGHILGAASVYITGREGSMFYSGDISVTPQKTVNGISIPGLRPDVLVLESTYGERLHSNRKVEEQRLIEIVGEVTGNNGKILIPAFAVGRAQEVILILRGAVNRKQLSPVPIYVDGMVKNILGIYRLHPNYLRQDLAKRVWREKDVFYSDAVKPVTSGEMRQKIAYAKEPCCIVSSSGMLTGGPSCFYAESLIRGRDNYIAITGYQDEEAPGRHLLDLLESSSNKKRVWRIKDKQLNVQCRMGTYALSAHADRGELLGVVQKLSPTKIFLVHGSQEARSGLGRELQSQVRGNVFMPRNGEAYTISFDNPRKQLKSAAHTSLNKGFFPDKDSLEELWAHVKNFEKRSGYTAEELFYTWSGTKDITEAELVRFRSILSEETYFKPDDRRLFLFHTILEDQVKKANEPVVMEVNEMLSLVDSFFPKETGLYKKGARFEQKITLLTFNFPAVQVPMCAGRISEFEIKTGWSVETNSQCNISAVKPLLKALLEEQKNILKKVSYFGMQNKVTAEFSKAPSEAAGLIEIFKTKTGIDLIISYPGKAPDEGCDPVKDNDTKMEQNAALSLIESVFREAEHELYKKGIKSDSGEKYIELSFISPVIGEKYNTWIKDLEKETGWRIGISPYPNQAELIQKAVDLLNEEGVTHNKAPSIFQDAGIVRFKLDESLDEDVWNTILWRFKHDTGFNLEFLL